MVFVIVAIFIALVVVIVRFNNFRNKENAKGYYNIPEEVRYMIDNEMVIELSELLVKLELNDQTYIGNNILKAIDYKGFGFAIRVDKVRNELRIRAGLGSLKL